MTLPVEDKVADQIKGFLGNLAGPRFRAVLDQKGEGVASEAGEGVTLPDAHAEVAGQLPEVAVTGAAASKIVKAFEFIQIQVEQAVAGFSMGFLLQGS